MVVDGYTVNYNIKVAFQVFEANIRVLGGLLSAHLLMEDPDKPFGDLSPDWYMGDLLTLAHDLADRLLPSFANPGGAGATPTGLPHPRVNLVSGVPVPESATPQKSAVHSTTTCTAGAGSLLLEMGALSRLLGDPVYESYARTAATSLYDARDNDTNLVGNVIDVNSGQWTSTFSGFGAGADSYYEYLLKSHILLNDDRCLKMFNVLYGATSAKTRRGRSDCNPKAEPDDQNHPLYVNVDMKTGHTANTWFDSLQAALPALQVLNGDLQEAICQHALYYAMWLRYGAVPERYDWKAGEPNVKFYPLRPELAEATYFLYRATKSPFYLHVGKDMVEGLNKHARTNCGYATIHDVNVSVFTSKIYKVTFDSLVQNGHNWTKR